MTNRGTGATALLLTVLLGAATPVQAGWCPPAIKAAWRKLGFAADPGTPELRAVIATLDRIKIDEGSHGWAEARKLADDVDKLGPAEKERVLAKVFDAYGGASKSRDADLREKNVYDALLSRLVNASEKFKAGAADSAGVRKLFNEHVAFMQQHLATPGLVGRKPYTGAEALAVAKKMQQVLIASHRKVDATKPQRLTLVGSFPSGRGRVGLSDIDVAYADQSQVALEKALDKAAIGPFGSSPAGFEVHDMLSEEMMPGLSVAQDLMIEITPTSIDLLVFPPGIVPHARFPGVATNPNPPARYPLDP